MCWKENRDHFFLMDYSRPQPYREAGIVTCVLYQDHSWLTCQPRPSSYQSFWLLHCLFFTLWLLNSSLCKWFPVKVEIPFIKCANYSKIIKQSQWISFHSIVESSKCIFPCFCIYYRIWSFSFKSNYLISHSLRYRKSVSTLSFILVWKVVAASKVHL